MFWKKSCNIDKVLFHLFSLGGNYYYFSLWKYKKVIYMNTTAHILWKPITKLNPPMGTIIFHKLYKNINWVHYWNKPLTLICISHIISLILLIINLKKKQQRNYWKGREWSMCVLKPPACGPRVEFIPSKQDLKLETCHTI